MHIQSEEGHCWTDAVLADREIIKYLVNILANVNIVVS